MIKTTQKTVYELDDGTSFDSYEDAMAYMAQLENEDAINRYLASIDKPDKVKARLRNDISKYLGFIAAEAVDSAEAYTAKADLDALQEAVPSEAPTTASQETSEQPNPFV